ncbi:MAG: EAL domain-containing protein [Thermodesulfovibrionales bacterium]
MPEKKERSASILILVFFLLSAGIVTTGYIYYRNYEKHYRTEVERQLSAIAEIKADELVDWRKGRLADASVFYKNDDFSAKVRQYLKTPGDTEAQTKLRTWIRQFQVAFEYDRIFLLDTKGIERMSVPDKPEPGAPHLLKRYSETLHSGQVTFLDFHRDAPDRPIHLSTVVPILDGQEGRRPIGVLVLRIDPQKYLYPFINSWPTPSQTAETLLVRREGNEVVFLNELKFQKNTALNLRIPIEKTEILAVKAVMGQQGVIEGKDYRGVSAIGDVRAVPDSPWFLVARMDTSEVYEPLRERLWIMVFIIGALLICAGAGTGFVWRHQRTQFYREKYEAAEALRESEERYRTLIENATQAVFVAQDGKLVFLNPMTTRMIGYSSEELMGKPFIEFIHPDDREMVLDRHFKRLKGEEVPYIYSYRIINREGEIHWVELNAVLINWNEKTAVLGFLSDITARKKAEEELKFRNVILSTQQEVSIDGILVVDESNSIISYNQRFVEMWGIPPKLVESKDDEPVLQYVATKPVDPEGFLARVKYLYEHKEEKSHEDIALKDGRVFDRYSAPMFGVDGRYYGRVWYFRDITERKQMEEKLQYLAYYDSLTGLPNRKLFLERINEEIAEAKDSSSSLAVVITDINKFKSIYDIYGSKVGDRVLKEVAERLSTAIRKEDIAAHLGNDEFGIACMGITGSDDIIMLEKIIKDISYPLKIDGNEITLAFSTGISLYPHDGENASELLKSAGLALSIAKKEGVKTSQFYTKDMLVMASEMLLLEKQLAKAYENEEFILHYQPYWDINTKKMVGMEALIRWQSQNNGLVPPGRFIPILEDTGMIIEVGEWILREATRQVKEWQNNGYPVVPVSVNMSLVQFRQKDLAKMVKKIMKDCGYYPSLLTLEITESAFMQNIEFTKSVLAEMKETGCSVSIDDFGTGYSSLAYLKGFPVDNLKIDISFIREMVKDPDSASIVVAIINMAHTLNLKTIAEGIETEEQWKFLRLVKCDMGQGFYLSKPLPAEEVEKMFNVLTPDK